MLSSVKMAASFGHSGHRRDQDFHVKTFLSDNDASIAPCTFYLETAILGLLLHQASSKSQYAWSL